MLHGAGAPSLRWTSPGRAPWGTAVCRTASVLRAAQPENTSHFFPGPIWVLKPHISFRGALSFP